MVRAKNYETMSTFVEVMQKKTVASFFGHGVVISLQNTYFGHRVHLLLQLSVSVHFAS